MKAAEYRDLISYVSDTFASFRSACRDHERRLEGERLRRALEEMTAANCPRASKYDREKATRLANLVNDAMAIHREQCREADANLQRMAFGTEWR